MRRNFNRQGQSRQPRTAGQRATAVAAILAFPVTLSSVASAPQVPNNFSDDSFEQAKTAAEAVAHRYSDCKIVGAPAIAGEAYVKNRHAPVERQPIEFLLQTTRSGAVGQSEEEQVVRSGLVQKTSRAQGFILEDTPSGPKRAIDVDPGMWPDPVDDSLNTIVFDPRTARKPDNPAGYTSGTRMAVYAITHAEARDPLRPKAYETQVAKYCGTLIMGDQPKDMQWELDPNPPAMADIVTSACLPVETAPQTYVVDC